MSAPGYVHLFPFRFLHLHLEVFSSLFPYGATYENKMTAVIY